MELAQKGKNLQGFFVATFKGELSKLLIVPKLKPELLADKKKKEG